MPRSSDQQLARHRAALRRARGRVEANERRWRDSIKARNQLVREAKQAGLSAGEAYELAGVNQSTFSRQRGGATGSEQQRR